MEEEEKIECKIEIEKYFLIKFFNLNIFKILDFYH
jgi:hypothetical protein